MLAQHPVVRNTILGSLLPEDLASLRPHLRLVQFRERTVLQEQKRRIEHVGFVESGVVSFRRTSKDDVVELALVGSNGIVGATRLLGGYESSHQCITIASGALFSIPADTLLDLIEERHRIREHLYRHVQMLFVLCSQVALCGLHHGLTERLASWLCNASDTVGGMEIPVTHDYLSTILGLRRPSVTEALIQLEDDGLIVKTRGALRVQNRALLQAKACGCHSTIADASGVPAAAHQSYRQRGASVSPKRVGERI